MGNYFSSYKECSHQPSTYCKSDMVDPSLLCTYPQNSTPVRCSTHRIFDPRSPTVDIDRTPIMVNEECLQVTDPSLAESFSCEAALDPRSPTAGITRTPLVPLIEGTAEAPTVADKEMDGLIQVLNFTDLDNFSFSDIESPDEEEEKEDSIIPLPLEEPVPVIQEMKVETPSPCVPVISATSSNNSTPSRTPVRAASSSSSKARRGSDENSLTTGKSPSSALLSRPRVPFGDVNRPALAASPRLQLQSKQKLNLRTEIHQQHHQQRF